jgi:DNA-binding XRE family transcriptional regulator
MKVQTIKTDGGDELIVMSRRDYDALLARAGDEEAEDRMTLAIAAEARGEATLPEPVSRDVLAGHSVLRAVRRWRGLTQSELAEATGLTQSFLSEIENRTKAGSPETLSKLAKKLDVPIGWLG